MKGISVLGSTGSIGRQTLDVCSQFSDLFAVKAIAAGSEARLLAEQALFCQPEFVAIADEDKYVLLKELLSAGGYKGQIGAGWQAVLAAAAWPASDMIVGAISGLQGLEPVLTAIEKGKDIALANKETLVAAGEMVTTLAQRKKVRLLPVDSEHSAIWQCLPKDGSGGVENLILTASGGPFRKHTASQLASVTPQEALAHPTWHMGPKVTIDSASLMNKGLEVMEAYWLFGLPYNKIKVIIHPQSIIHSMVQYADSAVLAHLGYPDMRVPIQLALTYPKRLTNALRRIDFAELAQLTFEAVDEKRFPCLRLAREAGMAGGTYPVVLNGANEELVKRFLKGEIGFCDIPAAIEQIINKHQSEPALDLSVIMATDNWARRMAATYKH